MDVSSLVVGSGPAGIACALALLEQGGRVTMVDAGLTLDSESQHRVDDLSGHLPSEWPKGATDFMTRSTQASVSGVKLKTAFGSDFAYRGTEADLPLIRGKTGILPSFARGGLSTVWGAAVLPLQQADLSSWPIASSDLEPHYRAVLKHIPLAAVHDDLEARFPLYVDAPRFLRPSHQAQSLLTDLRTHRAALGSSGITFGQSRLAVHAPDQTSSSSVCVFCGLCLSGCPYGAIYSSAHTLAQLQTQPRFTYLSRWIAKRVSETKDEAVLHGVTLGTKQVQLLKGSRIFLAGGVLSTTKILLDSLQAYDHPLAMATSQHFMFPLWSRTAAKDVTGEALHTLAQLFLEIDDPKISDHTIHLQLYTYNAFMRQALRRIGIGYLLEANSRLRDAVLGRLLVIQGYLHSADSSTIQVTLKKSSSDQESVLDLQRSSTKAAREKIQAVLKKLFGLKKSLGATPLSPALSVSLPGGGFHAGGTFPMRANPHAFESDRWGRPHGFTRVHAVDATVLPDIAATAITLNVMANAHRIGSHHE